MESCYDEDLSENIFLEKLQTDHIELFDKAICDGWVICVPRSGSFAKYAFTHDDFFNHILIPSDELPETHFRTLNNKDIRICNKLITLEPSDISKPFTTHILFEETFYTEEYLKYKLLCIERPLEPCQIGDEIKSSFVSVQTLRDCIDLLWTESAGKSILEKMDEIINEFLEANHDLEYKTLQVQRDATSRLYTKCLQVCLSDTRLRSQTCVNKYFLENIKIAVESYVHHHIYKKLIKGVTACTAYDDAQLNKIIRNLSDLQLGDLDIRADLHDTVPQARSELSKVDGYSTVLGKLGCLKRCLAAIAQESMNHSEGNIVNADDLLPIFVFLIIKTNLPNWIAHLTYLSQFRFSSSNQMIADTSTFLITSLEAAIEHIKSGSLLGSPMPESQLPDADYPDSALTYEMSNMKSYQANLKPKYNAKSNLYTLFEETRCGNLEKVKSILDNNNFPLPENPSKDKSQLCHPLCSCDSCEKQMSIILCNTVPTVYSCDDRGFTVLHIACLFGRPKIVDLLLSYGANPNVQDYSGSTPLHYAAARGHQNALLLILHATSDIIEQPDNEGNTALHLATENGHDGCVKALLYFAEHNGIPFNINMTNNQGDTALHFATRWGYENLVQLLCDYNANPLLENKRKLTPMDCAHNLHVANILTEHLRANKPILHLIRPYPKKSELVAAASFVSLDFSDTSDSFTSTEEYGTRPQTMNQIKRVEKLLRAIEFNDIRLMSYYLGFDEPVVKSASEQSKKCHPLCSCELCWEESEDEFIEQRSRKHRLKEALSVNVCNSDGYTPLHIATLHNRVECVRLLLDGGAKPNLKTKSKELTSLHIACQNERTRIIKLLLASGETNINTQDVNGNTPLHYACMTNNVKLVETLLKYEPKLGIKNSFGQTPLDLVKESMSLCLIKLLGGKPVSGL
ncbi:ankyrin repeat domain-containing protein 27 [Bemisia tabaci]|uniref:ankyrin repeat domain-containing protein 27 n=1 Tax=Bemisia tabaci TaxID=7038 RepID=UPI003B28D5D0